MRSQWLDIGGRLVVGREEQEKGSKGHEETSQSDGYVYYLDRSSGFTDMVICHTDHLLLFRYKQFVVGSTLGPHNYLTLSRRDSDPFIHWFHHDSFTVKEIQ